MDEEVGMQLTSENIEKVLDEIRPYLVGEQLYSLDPRTAVEPLKATRHCVLQETELQKFSAEL